MWANTHRRSAVTTSSAAERCPVALFFSFSKPPLTIKGKARMRKCTVMACKLTLKLHRLKHSGFYWARGHYQALMDAGAAVS